MTCRLFALAFAAALAVVGFSPAAGSCAGPVGRVAPDKNLFGVRAVAYLERQLTTNPNNLPPGLLLAAVRKEADALAASFQKLGLDPEVVGLAKDLVNYVRRYEEFLTKCGLINKQAQDQLNLSADEIWVELGGQFLGQVAVLEYAQLAGYKEWESFPSQRDRQRASAGDLYRLALAIADACELIPADRECDTFRVVLLATAGDLVNKASTRRALLEGKGLFGATTPYAARAIGIWKECIRYNGGNDPTGFLRMRQANVMVHDADFQGGYALAKSVKDLRAAEKCSMFAPNFARLCAIAGDHADAMDWLEFAVRGCGVNPGGLDTDEHLAAVTRTYPDRMKALPTLKR